MATEFDLDALAAQIEGLKLGVTVTAANFRIGLDAFPGVYIDANGDSADESERVWFYNNHIGGMFYAGGVKRGDAGLFLPMTGARLSQAGTMASEDTLRALLDLLP